MELVAYRHALRLNQAFFVIFFNDFEEETLNNLNGDRFPPQNDYYRNF